MQASDINAPASQELCLLESTVWKRSEESDCPQTLEIKMLQNYAKWEYAKLWTLLWHCKTVFSADKSGLSNIWSQQQMNIYNV